jgi:hypothetical protein
MALLTRDQILSAEDRRSVEVDVPEWGGRVRLAEMTAKQRDSYETAVVKAREADEPLNLRAAYVCRCLVDEDDQPLFALSDLEDLSAKAGGVLDRLFLEAVKLNQQTKEATDELPKD